MIDHTGAQSNGGVVYRNLACVGTQSDLTIFDENSQHTWTKSLYDDLAI